MKNQRKKPGPKPIHGVAMKRQIVMMDELTLRKARVIGNDNISRAVREAIELAYERYQRNSAG